MDSGREPWGPYRSAGPPLQLRDAVTLTLRHSPILARARQDLAVANGRLQETRGAFDFVGRVAPGGAYLQQELTPSLRGFERNRRTQLEILFTAFDGLNRGIGEALATMQAREPYCPPALVFADSPQDFITDRQDPVEQRVTGVDRDLRQGLPFRIDSGIIRSSIGPIRLGDICRATSETGMGAGQTLDLWTRINQTGRYGLNEVIDSLRALPEEINRFRFELTETIATRSLLARERLGELPRDEIRKQVFLEAGISKPLRSGLTLSLDARLESEERNFKDKPLDPTFGGFAIQPRFPSFVSLTADLPLMKGRGRVTVGAPERAATLTVRAQQARIRHLVTEEVFRTVLAYVNLVAVQESVRLLEQSLARQQQIATMTQSLLDVGEVPRSDVDRARAQAAAVAESLAARQLELIAARASLIQVTGLDIVDLATGPVAAETFSALTPTVPPAAPGTPAAPPAPVAAPGTLPQEAAVASVPPQIEAIDLQLPSTEALMTLARAQRRDPIALQSLEDASRVLANAATADLRRQVDLSLTAGWSTLYESPFARYLPDEVNPIFSEIAPPAAPPERNVRYYSARGFGRSLTGEWKPFVKALVTFDLPFGNRTARGRAAQARASLRRSQIERLDLDRRIGEHVNQVSGVLRALSGVIDRRRASTDALQRSLDASIEQFKIGELTLIDTLVTEEDLTRERLQLAADLQLFSSALARLKFETATLIHFDAVGTPTESIAFPSLITPPVSGPPSPPVVPPPASNGEPMRP